MLADLQAKLKKCLSDSLDENFSQSHLLPCIELEVPADKKHGEFSTNIALKSVKIFKKSPMILAGEFLEVFTEAIECSPLKDKISKMEVVKPGFINFFLKINAFTDVLSQILDEKEKYGASTIGRNQKILVEFVSANPTGPLSVAHARQAAVGDSLVNIFKFLGFDARKEYYVNDGGNQIKILGESIRCRCMQILGEEIDFIEDGYQGEYIKDIAQDFLKDNNIRTMEDLKAIERQAFNVFGKNYLLDVIKKELCDFGVSFDFWAFESEIATSTAIESMLDSFKQKGLTYQEDGALWFKSTDFGDTKDRVLRKSDGNYTYLTPDIVYHNHKFSRGFEYIVDILGPDHHGYIARLKAAAEALGRSRDSVNVKIVQLATISRDGEKVSMSTRAGQYVQLREVIDEVGVDAARFFFLMRLMSAHLDFDLELAKKETAENPVFYIQYACARINSINKKTKEFQIEGKLSDFVLLTEGEEFDLIKKISSFSDALMLCKKKLDPYPLISYLQSLAACFHKFYDNHRVVVSDVELSSQRLALINAAGIVLRNGLRLLAIKSPEKM